MPYDHLLLQEIKLAPSSEWIPQQPGCAVIRVCEGMGYWRDLDSARELNVGDAVILAQGVVGTIRASRLGPVKVEFFCVRPEFLGGILTLSERNRLDAPTAQRQVAVRFLPASDPSVQQFGRLCLERRGNSVSFRCRLLQLWVELFAVELSSGPPEPEKCTDARARFQQFLHQVPEAELQDCSSAKLARLLRCSPRHLSRLFREELGTSLRARQTELRLLKARQLLVDSTAKVINVAMDSGYRHLGLFNAMFKKRFGMTPTEWRRLNAKKARTRRTGDFATRLGAALLMLGVFVCSRAHTQEQTPPAATTTVRGSGVTRTNSPGFEVRKYEIAGNSILGPETLDGILTNALGPSVTLDRIRKAIGELQLAYRERGFPTVAVTLPQQQITNATIRIQVTEGVLAEIEVVGNRHFSSNNIMRALPSLRTNALLNSQVFQRELDLANGNRDRQIYPVIGPGPDPGTSSLKLKVKDRLPVHGRFELNNQATPGTPDLRMNLAAQYNNLWQHEHQFGLQYSFTPEELKDDDKLPGHFFDQPLVVNYSAYYRLPIGNTESVQEKIDANRFDFGYSEVTHQFRLPPNSGHPELTFYASRSTIDTGAKFGPSQIVRQQTTNAPAGQTNATLTIFSQDSGRDLTLSENLGTRVIIPLSQSPAFSSTFSFGADFKRYHLASFNTNNFHGVFAYTDPQLGSVNVIIPIDPSPQPVQTRAVDYVPFTISLDLSGSDKYGSTALSLNSSINLAGLLSGDVDFARAAYSTNAKASYSTLSFSLTRDQKLFRDWSLLLRGNGQLANGALLSNEQFGIGGTAGVRGYAEGEEYGDTGWRVLVEPRTPLANIGMVDGVLPMWVRASVFMDYGERHLLEASAGRKRSQAMWGTGIGVVANIGHRYDMRLTVAWPLLDTPFTTAGRTHVYFGLGAQF